MHWTRILGIALIVGGVVLLFMGLNASQGMMEGAHEAMTGRYTDDTTMYLVGGGIGAAVGIVLLLFGAKR